MHMLLLLQGIQRLRTLSSVTMVCKSIFHMYACFCVCLRVLLYHKTNSSPLSCVTTHGHAAAHEKTACVCVLVRVVAYVLAVVACVLVRVVACVLAVVACVLARVIV